MYAKCPDCETELDQHTGICPACRWDPILSAQPLYGSEPDGTFAERYSSADLESAWPTATVSRAPVSRTRAFILLGLVAMATLYWAALTVIGSL